MTIFDFSFPKFKKLLCLILIDVKQVFNQYEFLDQCRQMEGHCFETFSTLIEKDWGTIFYNPELPESHEANHAEVTNPYTNPFIIIKDISDFYSKKNLPARINFYDPDANHPFKKFLEKKHFKCLDTDSITTCMVLKNKILLNDKLNNRKDIRMSFTSSSQINSSVAHEIMKVLHTDWKYQNLVKNDHYYYFILYDQSEPVSVLSFFLNDEFKLARLNDIVTIPDNHNNNYSTVLLKFACKWAQESGFNPYLHVTNVILKEMYAEVGFEEVFRCQKSNWIKEFSEEENIVTSYSKVLQNVSSI